MRYHLFFFVLLTFLSATMAAQEGQDTALGYSLKKFIAAPELKNASVAVYIQDVRTGRTVLSHNPDLAVAPASVLKLVTTATILELLGPLHTFHTTLQYDGHLDANGILHGNLFIKGSGDPSLGSSRMHDTLSLSRLSQNLTQMVVHAGIRQINGHVVGDESLFDAEAVPGKYLWEDIGNYFGAGASGLSVNENEFTVFFNAGPTLGAPASVVGTDPIIPDLRLINQVTTARPGTGDQVYILGAPYQTERRLTGTVPLGAANFPVRGSLHDPPALLAGHLQAELVTKGIKVEGGAWSMFAAENAGMTFNGARKNIGNLESPPLFDLIARTNQFSVNTYSENLLKIIGVHTREQGSYQAGVLGMADFWGKTGMPLQGMRLYDGSGLSPSNRITARQLNHILTYMSHSRLFPVFFESLPLAGFSGTLAGQLLNTKSEGLLRAKSGSLANVRAFAGYTTTREGSLLAFTFIVNDYEGQGSIIRNKMLQFLDELTNCCGM